MKFKIVEKINWKLIITSEEPDLEESSYSLEASLLEILICFALC